MSGNLNSILLDGNLVRDPELRETTRGHQVCNFTIAANRVYEANDEKVEEVSYFDAECWGRLANACATHLSKGRGVRVVGRLKQDRWQDPEGKNRSKIKIVAEHVVFKPAIHRSPRDEGEGVNIEEGAEYQLLPTEDELPAMM